MGYWDGKQGAPRELRLLQQNGTWLAYDDSTGTDDKTAKGGREHIQEVLVAALHSTNLMVLLGSGASFAARNAQGISAPGMSDLWDCVRSEAGAATFDKIVGDVAGSEDEKDIENLLSLCKMRLELAAARKLPVDGAAGDAVKAEDGLAGFVALAEQAILKRVNFVGHDTDLNAHREFLRRVARRSSDKPRVKLFTTNYDRCIEGAADARSIVLIDGFSHSSEQRFNRDYFHHDIVRRSPNSTRADYVDGVFHLYKMHGSLDWRRRKDGVVVRSIETRDDLEPVLIYPRSTKYQEAFSSPYLDMFSAWQSALREPDTTLIVAGFGFADDHISAPIWSALESNLSLRLILCDPCFIPSSDLEPDILDDKSPSHELTAGAVELRKYQRRIVELVKQGDSRVTVLNGRFDDLALAMPEILGQTDRHRLEARLDRVREGTSDA
jgi:SIR2-like domain